ncbi:beta-lactamase domain-containing protein 2-like isoform X2 [Ruditapes philippinarum]|uniref:beta-lactamase domain-containing protein 2-like isoform X2 n=1 Tax=Ruditapes philippinarum TaxID=129788 RepID=UPI00295B03BD|nr:beta-lactamase domain-containing protein 2-like isoform X2 [Ruditapes philippinarum]
MLKKWIFWINTVVKDLVIKPASMKKANNLTVNGFTAPGFEKVAETFRANLKSGLDKGSSFAVYYRGVPVVNLWGGYSDISCRRLWKEDTLSTFFSSTKAVAALVIAHLVDRGLLDYKKPVCTYWPDFAQNGKKDVTLEQLISNQAGLITLEEPFWLADINNPVKLGKKLAAQKPFWTPGEKHGYHPLTFGLYLDQIVRHADPKQRSLSDYFKEEIAQPFDIELYIGLPKHLYHRATRVNMARPPDQAEMLKKFKGDISLLMQTANNPQDFKTTLKINDPDNRELPIPSTHGHATAANMAKLFGIVGNGGVHNGRSLLSQAAINRFTNPLVAGIDVSFGIDAAWSVGTHLITMVTGNQSPNHIFGHGGYGGQYAAADIKHKIGFAYTTPFLDPFSSYSDNGDERMYSLIHALYDCVFQIENIKEERIIFQQHSQYQKYLDKNQPPSKL